MEILNTVMDLRTHVATHRLQNKWIALVPTMGALHEGHLSLVEAAQQKADKVIVSIFVNPKQFGPNEDFDRYPRTWEADCKMLETQGVSGVYAPVVEEMYPDGFATSVSVLRLSEGLCGAKRPGHFDGVATVVSKLFMQALPDYAFFGEKDYQQLCVLRQMTVDLNIPVEVIGAPIKRDEHGLALSSRNKYLSEEERDIARQLNKILFAFAPRLAEKDAGVNALLEEGKTQILEAGFDKVDYLELRAENTLEPVSELISPARLLCAVFLGKTRLLDNVPVLPL